MKNNVESFALYRRSYPNSWPAWTERTGPERACVEFASGELVDLFLAWRRFQRTHPTDYRMAVARQIEAIGEDLLAERLCAQDMEHVRRELERLLQMLPVDPVAPAVRERLTAFSR